MDTEAVIARALADAFLAGSLHIDGLVERGTQLLGRRWRWLHALCERLCARFGTGTRPRQMTVARFIRSDPGFSQACEKYELYLTDRVTAAHTMAPVAAASSWNVPELNTTSELAEWLGISLGELDWFADRRRLEYKQNQGRLRHYHYRLLTKRYGQIRLVEAPKPRLKAIQRRILAGILDPIPAHMSAHGFRRCRSVRSFASAHVNKCVVLRLDLHDFFPSISTARVQALYRTVGYPELVADTLAGLCSNSAPTDIWGEQRGLERQYDHLLRMYSQPHLPQGAPTSPALANLCAYRMDCRLTALAKSAAASYTRYADDLAFSGDRGFDRVVKRFRTHVAATVAEEGFRVHHRKTRIMRRGVRQQLAGVVVNRHLNIRRSDYDRLKAILTNCMCHGAQSQNRGNHHNLRAHLLGKISFVEMLNPTRGRRLRTLFERIEW